MTSAPVRRLMSLIPLALFPACATESHELPSGPAAGIAAHRFPFDDSREAPQFSAWSAPVNLGSTVNSDAVDLEMAISKDELSLYIASNRSGNFDIWVSQRANVRDPWGLPQNLGPPINTPFREQAPFLSPDGHRLYFFSDRDPGGLGGTDLYVSERRDNHDDFGWQTPVNLGPGVNGSANEALPVVFEDEATGTTTLYLTSNRAGAPDIYASTLQEDETFGPAVLIAELSSPGRDRVQAIRRDGLEVFLGSDRGGPSGSPFDLWVATRARTSDPWSAPVSLGPPVNTSADESSASLSFDGTTLYFTSDRPGGSGSIDLWVTTRSRLHHTVLVDPNSSGDGIARTIQGGIAMAAPDGRVRVVPGTYNEAVVIDKGLTLEAGGGGRGEGHASGAVIVAPPGAPTIALQVKTPDPVTIRGLTVHFSGANGIRGEGIVDVTLERVTVLAVNPPLGVGFLVAVLNNAPTTGRARLAVRGSFLDGALPPANSPTPPFPQVFGIRVQGDVDALLEGNVIRRTGGACISVFMRSDFGGETNADILENDLDECYPLLRAGSLVVQAQVVPTTPVTATGVVNIVGNTIRNRFASCLVTTAISQSFAPGRIEQNRILGVVQPCATPIPTRNPGAIWIGSLDPGFPSISPAVRFNDIAGNAYGGLRVGPNIATAIDARCNWWGSASGPSAVGGSSSGDAIVVETGAATPVSTPFAMAPIAQWSRHLARCAADDWSEPVNLGASVNSAGLDQAPALSPDGLSLYFASDRAGGVGGQDLWVSRRASPDSPWEAPINPGALVNSSSADGGPAISNDGHLLFFQSDRPGGQGLNDIYVSRRANTDNDVGWGPPVPLGPEVNTAAADVGPWYLERGPDGPILYFSRGPSLQILDIYAAPVRRDGQTRGPATLVAELSHPGFTDGRTTVRTDGREVFFFSGRPGGFGATDLWVSRRRTVREAWSAPENLGAPPNSPSVDLQAGLSFDGRTLVFTSTRPGGFGGQDLWMTTRALQGHDGLDDGGDRRRVAGRSKGR